MLRHRLHFKSVVLLIMAISFILIKISEFCAIDVVHVTLKTFRPNLLRPMHVLRARPSECRSNSEEAPKCRLTQING